MITAIVLMNVRRGQVNAVAEELTAIEGVSEVYSVGGRYDLAVMVRAATNEDLAEVVTARLQAVEAIEQTETLIAFRAFSRHDLEAMFSVGLQS